jgi:hypothetical protein
MVRSTGLAQVKIFGLSYKTPALRNGALLRIVCGRWVKEGLLLTTVLLVAEFTQNTSRFQRDFWPQIPFIGVKARG